MSGTSQRGPLGRFERKKDPIAPVGTLLWRLLGSLGLGLLCVALALGIGVIGYHVTGGLGWLDALYNASMILSGMGPVDDRASVPEAEKWFASFYALFSGVAFLGIVGVIFAPLFHRFIHHFHVMQDDEDQRR